MLRSAPMAVLSSPVSKPLWPRCAVAPVLGTASALRPATSAPQPLQKPALEESVTQAETSDTVPRIDSLNSLHKSGNDTRSLMSCCAKRR
jgi:hypothetical protein